MEALVTAIRLRTLRDLSDVAENGPVSGMQLGFPRRHYRRLPVILHLRVDNLNFFYEEGEWPDAKKAPGPFESSQRPSAQRLRALTHSSTSKAQAHSSSSKTPTLLDSLPVSTDRPPSTLPASAASGSSSSSALTTSPTASSASTVRVTQGESYLDFLRDKHPTFEPKNDYEILTAVGSNYCGPESELRLMFAVGLRDLDDVARMDSAKVARTTERFIERARSILDQLAGSITGMKPKPGTVNIFCRPIPNSPYSIRLFPGSIAQREYCLDFVDKKTGKPVSSPLGFELWSSIPDSGATSWLGGVMTRMPYLGKAGAEKFVLRDGQTYVLKRLGHKDVQFKVPVRTDGLNLTKPEVDRLDFPEMV
ncbi:hypothetical protein LXA43DRAFT_1078154 [Ganoderma leucocontextum]|nr:hypothetical protein LXA43DRAFT_1078154 [Ganoderma leucocontextum]